MVISINIFQVYPHICIGWAIIETRGWIVSQKLMQMWSVWYDMHAQVFVSSAANFYEVFGRDFCVIGFNMEKTHKTMMSLVNYKFDNKDC